MPESVATLEPFLEQAFQRWRSRLPAEQQGRPEADLVRVWRSEADAAAAGYPPRASRPVLSIRGRRGQVPSGLRDCLQNLGGNAASSPRRGMFGCSGRSLATFLQTDRR